MDVFLVDSLLMDGFMEVFFCFVDFLDEGWISLFFYQFFIWDGISDLLLDVSCIGDIEMFFVQFVGIEIVINIGLGIILVEQYYLVMCGGGLMEILMEVLGMSQGVMVVFWLYGLVDILLVNIMVFEVVDGVNCC